ncbi:hypothetical protein ACINWCA92_1277 [Acinetobacter baumannii WC-A-92]|nr:hypothetical protein ACINWCA92_1277 [Acinetobacter baumannii WC-A-92]EXB36675.1 hypothetical protein J540_4101 [Acinetobacter baumannii 1440422]EXB37014.1 hypothetical protein J540_4055 [Acinetobacter baumannii 1440422]
MSNFMGSDHWGGFFYLTSLNDQHIKLIKNVSKYGNVL